MASFATYRDDYARLWSSLVTRPTARAQADALAQKLLSGKTEYLRVEERTGVPWWFVGLCHYRESDFNFETYLGNGQSLRRTTTIVPKGRGPFTGPDAFLNGAVDALRLENFVGAQDWSIARVLYRLEGFNGYGYHGRGVNSPYLWGGSTAYGPPETRAGKYVRDGVFDPNTVDTQCGTAVLLKALVELDRTIDLGASQAMGSEASRDADDDLAETTLWVQQSLNRLGALPALAEDGRNGPKTMGAVSAFQQRSGLDDTGLANPRTIAAIQAALQPAGSHAVDVNLRARLAALEQQLAAATRQLPISSAPSPTPVDGDAVVQGLAALRQIVSVIGGSSVAGATSSDPLLKVVQTLLATTAPGAVASGDVPLGRVNGALGQTIGTLLDGKKTAIGILGALVTQILSQVPAASGLGQVLGLITPAFGLSPYTMPLFIALAAWGALGKFEKWNQQSPGSMPTGTGQARAQIGP